MNSLNRFKFATDLVLFFLMLVVCLHKLTGDAIHEWLGIAILALLLVHLLLNWNWLVAVLKRFFSSQTFANRFNLIWDILLYTTMGMVILSGVLISRDVLARFGIHVENDPFMSYTHRKLTEILLILIGIHLGLHIKWLIQRFRRSRSTGNTTTSNEMTETTNVPAPATDVSTAGSSSAGVPATKRNGINFFVRLIVILIVGSLLTSTIFPVAQTNWADGIREQVKLARAKKHGAMKAKPAAESPKKEAPELAKTAPPTPPSLEQKADQKQGPQTQSVPQGPKAKAPNLSTASLKESKRFLIYLCVPFVITAIFVGFCSRKKKGNPS